MSLLIYVHPTLPLVREFNLLYIVTVLAICIVIPHDKIGDLGLELHNHKNKDMIYKKDCIQLLLIKGIQTDRYV